MQRLKDLSETLMDTDEIAPPPKRLVSINLEAMSIAELNGHIAVLEAEISDARAMIAKKQQGLSSADALFRR